MIQKMEGSSPKVRFTYQEKSNYFQSQARPSPHQMSASYTTSYVPRAVSLPHQTNISKYKPQQVNHIKILENSSYLQRSRKYKIFGQSPLNNHQTNRVSRVESRIENAQYKTNISQKSIEKPIQTLEPAKQSQSITNREQEATKAHKLDIQEINRYIDKRLQQKLSQIDSIKGDKNMRSSISNQQLRKKQQQIIYLKMEVQRLRRCEKINKQNQSLYLRLVSKLKETTLRSQEQSLISTSKKQGRISQRHFHNQSPMNELLDFKKTQNEKLRIDEKDIIINKKVQQYVKQPSPQNNLAAKVQRDYVQNERSSKISKAVTFNNSKESIRPNSHSKRVQVDVQRSIVEMQHRIMYNEMQYKTLSELPITNRLQQINNQLQRKLSRRSASKPKRQNSLISSTLFQMKTTSNYYRPSYKYQVCRH